MDFPSAANMSGGQRIEFESTLLAIDAVLGAMFLNSEDSTVKTKDIAKHVCKVIELIAAANVVQVITDNSANCKAACAIFAKKYQRILDSIQFNHGRAHVGSQRQPSRNDCQPQIQGLSKQT